MTSCQWSGINEPLKIICQNICRVSRDYVGAAFITEAQRGKWGGKKKKKSLNGFYNFILINLWNRWRKEPCVLIDWLIFLNVCFCNAHFGDKRLYCTTNPCSENVPKAFMFSSMWALNESYVYMCVSKLRNITAIFWLSVCFNLRWSVWLME